MSTTDPPIIITGGTPQGASSTSTSTASGPQALSASSPDGSSALSLDESSASSPDALSTTSPDASTASSVSATNVKLGLGAFPGLTRREFDDTTVPIVRVVVKDGKDKELKSFDFPDGKFKVEFHGPKTK